MACGESFVISAQRALCWSFGWVRRSALLWTPSSMMIGVIDDDKDQHLFLPVCFGLCGRWW
jgi:hypothetical protein